METFECKFDFLTGALLEDSGVFKNNLVQICTSVYRHTASRATRLVFVFNVDMLHIESTFTSDILRWLILILGSFYDLFTEILQRAVMYFVGHLYRLSVE
jgi:hypothetical protein